MYSYTVQPIGVFIGDLLCRSFNFEAWRKRFNGWVDQQKLRVNDLFRRFDSNHDGMLTREEFMKGLKASGISLRHNTIYMYMLMYTLLTTMGRTIRTIYTKSHLYYIHCILMRRGDQT